MRFNDTVFGVLLIALSLLIWREAATFPKVPGTQYGPAFLPQVLATGLGIAGLLLILGGIRQLRAGGAVLQLDSWGRQPERWLGAILLLALIVVYTLLDEWLGFHLTGFAVTLVFMLYLGVRAWQAALFSLGAVIVIWLLFARLLLVPLPGGVLTPYLW